MEFLTTSLSKLQPEPEPQPVPFKYKFSEDINKLYVCSDLEGSNPFIFNPDHKVYDKNMDKKISISTIENIDSENMVLTNNDVKTSVETIFNTDLTVIDGIITGINKNVALAYTGDLFDNRPYSFRLLKRMIELKTENPYTVIIIGGNRDYNKLRLGIELFMVNESNKHPFLESIDRKLPTLQELVNSTKLKYVMETVPEYLIHEKWKYEDTTFDEAMKDVYTSTFDKRLEKILEKSFGAKYKAYTREVKDIFSDNLTNSPKKLNRLLSLLFMAMCFKWDSNNLVNDVDSDGKMFNSLKGLIYKYMDLMHPVAYFDFGENTGTRKNGFLSHSGVMDFTAPLGFNPKAGTNKTDMTIIMRLLLNDKQKLLQEYNTLKDSPDDINKPNKYLTLVRYIGITGPAHNDHSIIVKGPANTNDFAKLNLPSVGGGIYDKIFNMSSHETNFPTEKYSVSTLRLKEQRGVQVRYNIFGHQPNPFFPTVMDKENTLNIGLDICKDDYGDVRENNNYSFAVLQINANEEEDKFIGRSKFGYNTDKGNSYDKSYKNKIMYYFNNITDFPLTLIDTIDITKHKQLILNLENFNMINNDNSKLELQLHTAKPFSRIVYLNSTRGGSKHICSKNCKKCHKHDHECMLTCQICEEENCQKKTKTRKHKKRKTKKGKSKKIRKSRMGRFPHKRKTKRRRHSIKRR